jgi:hypothetical protein
MRWRVSALRGDAAVAALPIPPVEEPTVRQATLRDLVKGFLELLFEFGMRQNIENVKVILRSVVLNYNVC